MKLEGQNIVIVSNEPWGDTWYSKHNYAWELSKKNKVLFINPPNKFKLFNIFKKNIEVKNIHQNLTSITYKNVLPVKHNSLRIINEKYIFKQLKKYCLKKNLTNIIFWTFDPIRLSETNTINPYKTILHAVDDYLFTYPSEKILATKADIIFCVSDKIAEKYKTYNSNVHVIPHAISNDELLPYNQNKIKKNHALFIGTIDKRIDLEYTEEIIKKFQNVTFNFAGKISPEQTNKFNLIKSRYNNVNYLGVIPFKEIKYIIEESHFCFVFKKIYSGNNIASHKIMHILAQGKPLFSTRFSDYENSDLLYMSNHIDEMIQLIEKYLQNAEPVEKISQRINYCKQYTFNNALLNIEQLLSNE